MAKKSLNDVTHAGDTSADPHYRTLIERTYRELREDIVSGRLAPREKLLIEHLKDRYAVGAGTLREALSRLVSNAMVIAEGQRGFTVAPITIEELIDITNVRVSVETEALRTSIRQGNQAWRDNLRETFDVLSTFEQPLKAENVKNWELANTKFHQALLAGCQSPWTLRVIRQLTQHCERYRRFAIGLQSGRDVHSEHALIFESAIDGKDARAALALEVHIRATPELIISTIQGGVDVFKQV